jgi:hypothetical protein
MSNEKKGAIPRSLTTERNTMKLLKLLRGFLLALVASMTLATAMAGSPAKGVPTTAVPRKAPPPKLVLVPPLVVQTPTPTVELHCYWEEEATETVYTPTQSFMSPGYMIDPICGSSIYLSPIMATVPGSTIRTNGANFVCKPVQVSVKVQQ